MSPAPRWPGPGWRGRAAPLAAAAVLFAGLALFGARWHWVEEAGSAERDGYVAQAETLAAGELPRDPYRPLLYPLLAAALAPLAGGAFPAARLISNAAAAALALATFALARRLADGGRGLRRAAVRDGEGADGGRRADPAGANAAAWGAFALAAVNPNLWTIGQHATTDMLFAALAAWALVAGLAYLEAPGWRPALAGGALLGLAAFTRGNALFLAPGMALAWWLAPRRAEGRRVAHLVALGLAALVVVAPHFALRAAVFGDPFHDENWKNLAWKLHGFPDWSYLDRVPYAGPGELLREEAGAVVAAWWAELGRFAGAGLAQLLGTWAHVLAFVAGAAAALAGRRRREAGWLLAAAGLLVAGVALVFFAWGRLLLVVVPAAAAVTSAPWTAAAPLVARLPGLPAGPARRRRLLRRALAVAALALVALLAAKTFFFRLPAFVARHPVREVAVARALAAASPPGTVLAGTSPFLGRYLDRRYVDLPDAFGPEIAEPARYYRRLAALAAAEGIDLLVVGRLDLRDRPSALLGEEAPAPWLAPEGGDERVRVWRVVAERLPPAAR